jgi:pimeloyl-ACP methyl ester carboxylesterase
MMKIKRAVVAGGIVLEYIPPKKPSGKVMIFCSGLPSMPGKSDVLKTAARRGYHAISFRYRGTWESGGKFLDHSPAQDVLDVICSLEGELVDVWSKEVFRVHAKEIVVVGSSFGGTAALLCAQDSRVDKVVALSPVVDWTRQGETESSDYLLAVVKNGYGGAFRFGEQDWERLFLGEFYQPIEKIDDIESSKVFIVYTKDDEVVPAASIDDFIKKVHCKSICLKKGGHLGVSAIRRWVIWRAIKRFL